MKSLSRVRLFSTPWTVVHGTLQARNTGVGSLLQGIFPTQGSNLGLPHCRQTLYHLSHQEVSDIVVSEIKKFQSLLHFPVAQMVKCLPTMRETQVQSLGRKDLLEKEMAPHSSTLAWKIPWTEEPGRLQSMGSLRARHD